MRDLEGRTALVTGGGKGVGRVIASHLARRGAHVVLNCFHSLAAARETQAELVAGGATADVIRASVAKEDQVARMFAEVEERHGGLDILVNNAADGWLGPVEEVTAARFARALDTNLLGSFWCARAAAPLLARRGGGCIVNVSSNGAGMVPDNYLVVGTSKAGLEALTRHLAAEYAPLGIRVNTASCSLLEGDVARLFPRSEQMQRVTVASTPLGRMATADDLAGVVDFLTSDLSRWVTGQVVLADGGLSLGNVMLSAPKAVTAVAGPAAPGRPTTPRPDPAPLPGSPASPDPAPGSTASPDPAPGSTAGPDPAPEPLDPERDPVVVVGMGMVAPGASDPEAYWDLVQRGAELFVEVPPDRWDGAAYHSPDPSAPDKTYQSRSGFLTGHTPEPELAAELSAGGLSGELGATWLRQALRQALRGVTRRPGDRATFCVGYTPDGSQHLEEALVLSGAAQRLRRIAAEVPGGAALADTAVRALGDRLRLGAPGPARFLPHRVGAEAMAGLLPDDTELLMLDTACSSSLYAVDVGVKSLLLGTADVAVCGGAFALGPRGAVLFSKLHGLSTGGAVRSLDAGADGVLFSDGAAAVVLKRLSRARADGDTVLGVLAGLGSSSDGKGKAIYAPSSDGQRLAVDRALASPGVAGEAPDWVIAHATGTPAGDLAEVTTLREAFPGPEPVYVTSNKSLIGHTGWAAGVISLVEVLLALRHGVIPRQHRFQAAPAHFALEGSALVIPTQPVPWAGRPGRARRAAVSGFGFGGTNAHLVVQEDTGGGVPVPAVDAEERLAVVGWSTRLPGLTDPRDVRRWLTGGGPGPAAGFGDDYPLPPLTRVRIPPGTARVLDRCQLMLLESVLPLRDELGEFWEASRSRAGVFAGHFGPTRTATLYAERCYLDDLGTRLAAALPEEWQGGLADLFGRYADEVRRLVPVSSENSFPGIMPNVIPARVANHLDLHGATMAVDTGFSSALAALDVAARYLRAGDLDLALVAGVHGNSTPEAVAAVLGQPESGAVGAVLAEGAFTLAVTRESTARQHDLPVLALLEPGAAAGPRVLAVDVDPRPGRPSYAGAEAARALLTAVLDPSAPAVVTAPGGWSVTVRPPAPARPETTVRPHESRLVDLPLERARPSVPFVAPGTVVVTDDPGLLDDVAFPAGSLLLTTVAPERPGPHVVPVPEPSAEAVRAALAALGRPVDQVRCVTDLALTQGWDPTVDPSGRLALHDLLFLTAQACEAGLRRPGAGLGVCLLGGVADGVQHPHVGLFTGLVKSISVEIRSLVAVALVTATRVPAVGLAQLEEESGARHLLPVVVRDAGRRRTPALVPLDGPEAAPDLVASGRPEPAGSAEAPPPPLGPDSVVLAAGGSRGIAAEVLKEVARRYRPVVYVLGSTDVEAQTAPLPPRGEFLRAGLAASPARSVAARNREYDTLAAAAAARDTIAELRGHCGEDRVRYLRCDVQDREAVSSAVTRVLEEQGRVDVVLDVAGINRAADLASKRLEDFRAVRDLKVRAYHHLKSALGDVVPRLWVSFGSIVGFTGQSGETDYAAGNDFLATAAAHEQASGRPELALGWCLWRDAGLGADPVKKAFLQRSGIYTGMGNDEGTAHFLREVSRPGRPAAVMLLGESERAALEDYRPGFLAAGRTAVPAGVRGRFYLDRVVHRDARRARHERVFDLERDGYLTEHLVQGHPTLPGTFVTEIAAEAAVDLVPGRVPAVLEDLVFAAFLRVHRGDRPVRKAIEAELVSHDDLESVVRVRVLGDVVAPSGQVLVRDRLHFSAVVRLRDALPAAPSWEPWSADADGPAVPDPYHLPNPVAFLSGRLVSTVDTRLHALGRRATYRLAVSPDDPAFGGFVVPAVLLDGLLRVSVLDPRPSGHLLLAAPTSIRRIDLYTAGGDLAVAAAHPVVDLYSAPKVLDLESAVARNRCVAATPEGRVLVQVHDTATAVVGGVHPGSGEFLTPGQMARRSATGEAA